MFETPAWVPHWQWMNVGQDAAFSGKVGWIERCVWMWDGRNSWGDAVHALQYTSRPRSNVGVQQRTMMAACLPSLQMDREERIRLREVAY
jgi:hypothetical protein